MDTNFHLAFFILISKAKAKAKAKATKVTGASHSI